MEKVKKGSLPPAPKATKEDKKAAIDMLQKANDIGRRIAEAIEGQMSNDHLAGLHEEVLELDVKALPEGKTEELLGLFPEAEETPELENDTHESEELSELKFEDQTTQDNFSFVKFENIGDSFTGKFIGTMNCAPDKSDECEPNLEGLKFKEYGGDSFFTHLVSPHFAILKYFHEAGLAAENHEGYVYRITYKGSDKLQGGKTLKKYQIQRAEV